MGGQTGSCTLVNISSQPLSCTLLPQHPATIINQSESRRACAQPEASLIISSSSIVYSIQSHLQDDTHSTDRPACRRCSHGDVRARSRYVNCLLTPLILWYRNTGVQKYDAAFVSKHANLQSSPGQVLHPVHLLRSLLAAPSFRVPHPLAHCHRQQRLPLCAHMRPLPNP